MSTKISILESYLLVAQREGVSNVTLQKVAKQAKIAYGTVHYHFGGENVDLLAAALCYVAEVCETFVEAALAPALVEPKKNALRIYVEAKLAWQARYPAHASMLCYVIYQASREPKHQALGAKMHAGAVSKIKGILLAEFGKGHYAPSKFLEDLAEEVFLILSGGQLVALGRPPAQVREVLARTWRLVEARLALPANTSKSL